MLILIDLRFLVCLTAMSPRSVSNWCRFPRSAWADVVSWPGGAGCAYGGDDLLAVGGRLHRPLAGDPVEQAVAEFAF
jgi:hypothetical protein